MFPDANHGIKEENRPRIGFTTVHLVDNIFRQFRSRHLNPKGWLEVLLLQKDSLQRMDFVPLIACVQSIGVTNGLSF